MGDFDWLTLAISAAAATGFLALLAGLGSLLIRRPAAAVTRQGACETCGATSDDLRDSGYLKYAVWQCAPCRGETRKSCP